MKIQRKLIGTYLGIAMIPTLITGCIMLVLLYGTMKTSTSQYMEHSLYYCADKINKIISDTELLCSTIAGNSEIQKMLREFPAKDTPAYYQQRLNINNRLYSLRNASEKSISSVCILLEDGRTFKGQEFNLRDIDYQEMDWYQEIRQKNGSCVWYGLVSQSLIVHNFSGPYITAGYPLTNLRTGRICGIILVDITEHAFQEIFKDIFSSQSCGLRLLKENGESILETGFSETDRYALPLSTKNLLSNGWLLVLTYSVLDLIRPSLLIATVTLFAVTLMVTALTFVCSNHFSKSVSRPLNQLLKIMDDVEHGNLKAQIRINTNLIEINQLFGAFNTMVGQVNQLFKKLEEEQTEIRNTQFAALQAQINPHFLYNTLDSIAWYIRNGSYDTALKSLMSVSKLFRISLSRGLPYIPIRDELEHARMYLELMAIRYDGKLSYSIEPESPELLDFFTPKLLLQPLIENSIAHGISPREPFCGTICVRVRLSGNDVLLLVTDDGIGIGREQLLRINRTLSTNLLPENPENASHGFGIYNINRRLKSRYGDSFGLTIDCGKTTVVSIRIPKCNRKGECIHDDQSGNC